MHTTYQVEMVLVTGVTTGGFMCITAYILMVFYAISPLYVWVFVHATYQDAAVQAEGLGQREADDDRRQHLLPRAVECPDIKCPDKKRINRISVRII
jgi:hypothetical protein